MTTDLRTQTTQALRDYLAGLEPGQARDQLLALVYDDLRRLAASYLRSERPGHTLSPTDLVHEAYTRLIDQSRVDWKGRTHFFAVSARMMRRILVDHARHTARIRHGRDWKRVTLDPTVAGDQGLEPEDVVALDDALDRLGEIDPRGARVIELRFFVGLGNDEIAEVLDVSAATVARDWVHARNWLRRELSTGGADRPPG